MISKSWKHRSQRKDEGNLLSYRASVLEEKGESLNKIHQLEPKVGKSHQSWQRRPERQNAILSYLFQTEWKQASEPTQLQQVIQLPDTQQGLPACLFISFLFFEMEYRCTSNVLHKLGVGYVPLSWLKGTAVQKHLNLRDFWHCCDLLWSGHFKLIIYSLQSASAANQKNSISPEVKPAGFSLQPQFQMSWSGCQRPWIMQFFPSRHWRCSVFFLLYAQDTHSSGLQPSDLLHIN